METCVVGCKLPHGLEIDLNAKLDEKGIIVESTRVKLKGANSARVMGGYGITRGVDKAAFVEWLKTHARSGFVINGSVFMVNDDASARDRAREGGDATGLEPIDPLKRGPKTAGVEPIGEDEKKAAAELAALRANNPLPNRQIDELRTE